MARALLFLTAESPVHAGADTSDGVVDMPIQRERTTDLPVIWGQSLKGALRERARRSWTDQADRVVTVFGSQPPGTDDANSEDTEAAGTSTDEAGRSGRGRSLTPGRVAFGDAQLVLFPVPTEERTFCWATSGAMLTRLARKAELCSVRAPEQQPAVVRDSASNGTRSGRTGQVVVGQYVIDVQESQPVSEWATWLAGNALPVTDAHALYRTKMRSDTVVVADSLLGQLSVECAELIPRIQLEQAVKTVKHGPYYTEYLPTDTVMAALLESEHTSDLTALADLLDGQVLRLGGDETIGKGLMWCRVIGIKAESGAGNGVRAGAGAAR